MRVAALLVDDEATIAGLIARHGLTFPVGFGADARAIADLTGAFINPVASAPAPAVKAGRHPMGQAAESDRAAG